LKNIKPRQLIVQNREATPIKGKKKEVGKGNKKKNGILCPFNIMNSGNSLRNERWIGGHKGKKKTKG